MCVKSLIMKNKKGENKIKTLIPVENIALILGSVFILKCRIQICKKQIRIRNPDTRGIQFHTFIGNSFGTKRGLIDIVKNLIFTSGKML